MEPSFDIKLIFGSDFIGMILVVVLLVGNIWRLRFRSLENKILITMLVINFFCCLSDALTFAADGMPGESARIFVFASNTWLFASNTLCAFSWYVFLKEHLKVDTTSTQRWVIALTMTAAAVMLVVNFFYPIIFSVDENNRYHREFLYLAYIIINYFIIICSLTLYFRNYRKDGVSKFFPIWLYIIPILAATVIQTMFYGVSLMASSFAISICGAFTSLQNEQVFKDRLTGLFNRPFLDFILELYSQKDNRASGIKLNICDFRKINEKYGHAVGDRALCVTARLIQKSIGQWGASIRYAGDEFIILINSQKDVNIANCIEKLHMNFDKFNRETKEPYKLLIAIGCKKFDAKNENIDNFLNGLDKALDENRKAIKAS